jgi:hypothetical protein
MKWILLLCFALMGCYTPTPHSNEGFNPLVFIGVNESFIARTNEMDHTVLAVDATPTPQPTEQKLEEKVVTRNLNGKKEM